MPSPPPPPPRNVEFTFDRLFLSSWSTRTKQVQPPLSFFLSTVGAVRSLSFPLPFPFSLISSRRGSTRAAPTFVGKRPRLPWRRMQRPRRTLPARTNCVDATPRRDRESHPRARMRLPRDPTSRTRFVSFWIISEFRSKLLCKIF
jgi:hypothetical protein